VFNRPATEVFTYDADGNLTQDGRWTYTWDGENRLIEMKRDTGTPAGARQRLVFEYDHQGRRIRKQFYTHNGSNWVSVRILPLPMTGGTWWRS
jgi:YD repeat-containing protein